MSHNGLEKCIDGCGWVESHEGCCPVLAFPCSNCSASANEPACDAESDRWQNHPETLDYAQKQSELHRLIDALEAGARAYDARSNLVKGAPLKVESLEATMKVVTFNETQLMPFRLRRYADMCARAAKWCRFLRFRSWEDLFKRAEASFIADYHHARAVIDSRIHREEPSGRATGEGSSPSQP